MDHVCLPGTAIWILKIEPDLRVAVELSLANWTSLFNLCCLVLASSSGPFSSMHPFTSVASAKA